MTERLRALWYRICGLLSLPAPGQDLEAELESHLEMHIDDNLRAGMTPQEARRQALIALGGLEQTRLAYRDRATLPWVEALVQDLRYALRQMGRAPAFAALVVATLALGIGLNTALFSIVDAVLLRPVALPQAAQLVTVDASKPNFPRGSISYPNFRDWQRENHTLAALAIYRGTAFVLSGAGDSERLHGEYVSSDFFSLLGVKPVVGRLLAPGEDEIGGGAVALISAGLWARKFGSRRDVLGRVMKLDGRDYTVVGVIPADFRLSFGGFRPRDVYVPIGQWQTGALKLRGAGLSIHGIARLKPGVALTQARADMDAVSAHLAAEFPNDDQGTSAALTPLRRVMVGGVQPVLLMLLGAVGFVLLIACVNVANLLLARSTARAHEFAVRLSLGASRGRIVRQMLTESTLLALLGGAIGLLLAGWGTRAALRLLPAALPRESSIHLSLMVLAFTGAVSVAAGLIFGLLPAWRVASQPPQLALKDGGRGTGGTRKNAQDWLVAFEMAAAVVLLCGAGLMIRSFVALSRTSPGFDPKGVTTFSLAIPWSPAIATPKALRVCLREVDSRILAVPGVHSVALMWAAVPLSGGDDEELFWKENEPRPASENGMHWSLRYIVEPGYRKAMGIPLLRGRFLSKADRADGPPVVVIDQDFARQFFGDANPVGKQINLQSTGGKATIVGVVGHVMQWGLDNDAGFSLHAEMYEPLAQISKGTVVSKGGFYANVVVKADHADTAFADIRAALRGMNRDQVAYGPETMAQIVAETLATRRFAMLLLDVFAGLALLLAGVGLYGVISCLVGQRRQEMAIRMALGAGQGTVLLWVIRRGVKLAAMGMAAGVAGALVVNRLMASVLLWKTAMLYGVRPYDPATMAGVVMILMLVALGACSIPARRAAATDPMEVLREG